jgi:hypothetical protein
MTGARGRPMSNARRTSGQKASRGVGRQHGSAETRPVAGGSLLAVIDAVLPHLTSPGPTPPSAPQLVDDLRAALAHTAARGETCRVATAADVRLAATLLLASSDEGAQQALCDARTSLKDTSTIRCRAGWLTTSDSGHARESTSVGGVHGRVGRAAGRAGEPGEGDHRQCEGQVEPVVRGVHRNDVGAGIPIDQDPVEP